jgi:uncharacterized phage-associated protein
MPEKDIHFKFNHRKAAEAIACLMRRENTRRMNHMRLLKLLYIADRECLRQTGRTITGDNYVAMDRGPVLSKVYDLIRGKRPEAAWWQDRFKTVKYDLCMRNEGPGLGLLSRIEVDILQQVSHEHETQDEWDLVNWCHDNLPEWRHNKPAKGSSVPIPVRAVIAAVGRSADRGVIARRAEEHASFDRLFGAQT